MRDQGGEKIEAETGGRREACVLLSHCKSARCAETDGKRPGDGLDTQEECNQDPASGGLAPTEGEGAPLNRNNCESRGVGPGPTTPILTVGEAADLIRCSKTHLLNAIHGRIPNVPRLPCVAIGRRILVRRDALDRWLLVIEGSALSA